MATFDLKVDKNTGDFSLDPSGDIEIVAFEDKIAQEIRKILTTYQLTNVFHPDYGVTFIGKMGHPVNPDEMIETLRADTIRALDSLKATHANQAGLSDRETLANIDYIEVKNINIKGTADKRGYTIYIQVTTTAGNQISKQYTVTV